MAISLNKLQQENIDQAKEIIEMRVRLEEKIGQEANEMRANITGKRYLQFDGHVQFYDTRFDISIDYVHLQIQLRKIRSLLKHAKDNFDDKNAPVLGLDQQENFCTCRAWWTNSNTFENCNAKGWPQCD